VQGQRQSRHATRDIKRHVIRKDSRLCAKSPNSVIANRPAVDSVIVTESKVRMQESQRAISEKPVMRMGAKSGIRKPRLRLIKRGLYYSRARSMHEWSARRSHTVESARRHARTHARMHARTYTHTSPASGEMRVHREDPSSVRLLRGFFCPTFARSARNWARTRSQIRVSRLKRDWLSDLASRIRAGALSLMCSGFDSSEVSGECERESRKRRTSKGAARGRRTPRGR